MTTLAKNSGEPNITLQKIDENTVEFQAFGYHGYLEVKLAILDRQTPRLLVRYLDFEHNEIKLSIEQSDLVANKACKLKIVGSYIPIGTRIAIYAGNNKYRWSEDLAKGFTEENGQYSFFDES